MMGATIKPVSHTIEDESGCDSVVNIDYTVMDLTGGQKPISYVQLDVDGDELTSCSGTARAARSVPQRHDDRERLFGGTCHRREGRQQRRPRDDIHQGCRLPPPLSTHFEYAILDVPESPQCLMQLVIKLQAADLTIPQNPITNVVVKGNGTTWSIRANIDRLV